MNNILADPPHSSLHLCYNIAFYPVMIARTMEIFINGASHQIAVGYTVEQLLQYLDITTQRLAVEINKEIVPRSQYPSHLLQEHDHIEIVQAIGGG